MKLLGGRAYDVLVVGGGPAGTAAARAAASGGLSVAIVEQDEGIAQHVRTSGVTWVRDARDMGIPEKLYNRVSTFNFVSPNNFATLRCESDAACVLNVRGAFQYFAERAAEAGAEIHLRARVSGPVLDGEGNVSGVVVNVAGSQYPVHSKVVIDASGFHSAIARELDFAPEWRSFGVGAEIEAVAENVREGEWFLMVGSQYSPAGYAWIFPVGGKRVRVGVGIGKPQSKENPTSRLEELILRKPGPVSELGKIVPIEFHYGMVPNQGLRNKLFHRGVAVVGDSAGQANPLVLEGIRYAARYGELCGRAAVKYILGKDERAFESGYESVCRSEIESRIRAALRVQARWLTNDDVAWDREIDILRALSCEDFLDFIRADFTPGLVAKVAARHPLLAARELFALLRGVIGS
jgi:digeranylgeranylglycerophospholipid reductase